MQHPRPRHPGDVEEQRAAALTKAALESARLLGLSPHDTATILGVPQGALTAMKKGERTLDGYSGEAERADALVRIVKRLHALLGAGETNWRSWLRKENAELGARPIEILLQRDGGTKLIRHLEGKGSR